MQILIRAKGFPITEEINNHIRGRIYLMLSRFSGVIRKIEVYLADENGPKGGIDKACVVRIKTDQHSELVVKDIQADLYASVGRVLARAKQSLTRHIKRARVFDRKRQSLRFEEQLERERRAFKILCHTKEAH